MVLESRLHKWVRNDCYPTMGKGDQVPSTTTAAAAAQTILVRTKINIENQRESI